MSMSAGRSAREYAKFREIRHGKTAVAIINDDEATIRSLEVLASGNTEILPAPGEEANYVLKGFHFSNANASTILVSLRAGTGGQKIFTTMLAASGGNLDKNLLGRYWRLPLNKALVANLSGAGDVWVTIEYEVEGQPAQEAVDLTDSLVIAESLVKVTDKIISDAQSISEAITGKAIVKGLSDTLAIAETLANATTLSLSDALVITESEIEGTGIAGLADSIAISESLATGVGKSVADTLGIAEAVANQITLGLSDAVGMDDSQIVIVHTPG